MQRKVYSVIVWIGSVDRYRLMEDQALVLFDHPFDSYFRYDQSQEYVVPFFSSEEGPGLGLGLWKFVMDLTEV